jgi:hypothetical protein
MLTKTYCNSEKLHERYLVPLLGLQAQARWMNNTRVVVALQCLIDRVSLRESRMS